jgi:hypothetical protein
MSKYRFFSNTKFLLRRIAAYMGTHMLFGVEDSRNSSIAA